MIGVELELSKEQVSKRPKDFIAKQALIQYIEDMEDIQKFSVLSVLEEND